MKLDRQVVPSKSRCIGQLELHFVLLPDSGVIEIKSNDLETRHVQCPESSKPCVYLSNILISVLLRFRARVIKSCNVISGPSIMKTCCASSGAIR